MERRRLPPQWFLQSRLRLRHLQVLVALARHGKLHKAADQVGLSQPAASKLLIDLETALEQPLFERRSRALEPNAFGAILTRRAQAIMAELEGARDEINALQDGHLGRVAIGSIDAPAILTVTRAVAQAQTLYPRMEVEVQAESSGVLLERLVAGQLDMVLGRPTGGEHAGLITYREIADESLLLIGRIGHPLARRTRLAPAELRDEHWILQAQGSRLRARVDAMFHEAGQTPPQRIVSANSLLMTLAYVTGTDAISMVSEAVARQQAACGQVCILPLSAEVSAGRYGLILPAHRPLSPAAATMIRLLFPTETTEQS